MQSHIESPQLLAALGLSMLAFKPEWQARVEANPRSALYAILLLLMVISMVHR